MSDYDYDKINRRPEGWCVKARDMTELMHKTIRLHFDHPKPDIIHNIETHLLNVTLQCDSCAYDMDLGKNVWLNIGRWSRLIKEYVPREPLETFIANAVLIMAGVGRNGAATEMKFRDPIKRPKKHRWGGCMMGATFMGNNTGKGGEALLTLYSRTTYMGYMSLLDIGIMHLIAKQIIGGVNLAKKKREGYVNQDLSNISFRWHLSSQQIPCFKVLPYVYSQPDMMDRLEWYESHRSKIDAAPATWYNSAKWFSQCCDRFRQYGVKMLQHEKYGPLRRIQRRWLEHKGHLKKNVPPSLPITDLTFKKAI